MEIKKNGNKPILPFPPPLLVGAIAVKLAKIKAPIVKTVLNI